MFDLMIELSKGIVAIGGLFGILCLCTMGVGGYHQE